MCWVSSPQGHWLVSSQGELGAVVEESKLNTGLCVTLHRDLDQHITQHLLIVYFDLLWVDGGKRISLDSVVIFLFLINICLVSE